MVKFFNLAPDGHYGYPEVHNVSDTYLDPPSREELIGMYKECDCSAFAMNESTSLPDEEDFDSDEEYNAALEEREEEISNQAEYWYSEYGHYDVFDCSYLVISSFAIDLANIISDIMGYDLDVDDKKILDELMQALSEKDGIDLVISLPDGKLATKGELKDIEIDGTSGVLNIKDIVVKLYIEGDKINAAKVYGAVVKTLPEIESEISKELSPEDMEGLKKAGKGSLMTRRFSRDSGD